MDNRQTTINNIRATSNKVQKVYKWFKIIFAASIAILVWEIAKIMMVDSKGFITALLEAFGRDNTITYERMTYLEKFIFIYFDRQGLLVYSVIAIVIMAVLTLLTFGQIQRVFKIIAETEKPFNEACLKELRKMVIYVTVREFLGSTINGVLSGFALYCMLKIYEYGCQLQVESDDTV
ncbi:MAG: hypothetical protein IJJ19_02035 [Erysipelotrichaceae bacterium]|nr:hypothetical protein [Erysipelotrichaceae bacterium]